MTDNQMPATEDHADEDLPSAPDEKDHSEDAVTPEDSFDADEPDDNDLVRSLRAESRKRKERAQAAEERLAALEAELADHRRYRLEQTITEIASTQPNRLLANPMDLLDLNRLINPDDLLNDDGTPSPEKIEAAIADLLARKPHLRATGGFDGGFKPGPTLSPSLGSLIGRAARGED
jgi:hypothetical protein